MADRSPRGCADIRLHLRALVFHPMVAEVYRPFGLYALEGFIGPERAAPATSLSRGNVVRNYSRGANGWRWNRRRW
jgi:hypothetical protein